MKCPSEPKKHLGQNFLTDQRILEFEADSAGLGENDTVLEIGPGDGRLTRVLAKRAGRVEAIEKDERMKPFLSDLPGNVNVAFGDVLKANLPRFNKVVANIPYNLSSPIVFLLLDCPHVETCILTVQKEFAERLVAKPKTKQWGRLGATVSFLADAEILRIVPSGAFFPKPKVDSAVVRLVPKGKPPGWKKTKAAIDALFVHPGKTVKNALKGRDLGNLPDALRGKRVRTLEKGDIEEIGKAVF